MGMKEELTQYLVGIGDQIGVEFYYVGGSVRDELLGLHAPDDFDLVVRGLPMDELMEALRPFGGVELTGQLFPVLRFHTREAGFGQLDLALPRTEVSNGSGHNDWEVMTDHTLSIEEDLVRRDFTVNAMAENLKTGELHDPLGGKADLEAGVLRSINNQSFEDDPLRVIRGMRFVAKLGFEVEAETLVQMTQNAHLLVTVSGERFQMEFLKMLTAPHVGKALRLLRDIGALPHFLPELQAAVGCAQNQYHSHDVFEHTVRVVENCTSRDPYVRLGALLHDIGKPKVKWVGLDGVAHFYMPEKGQEFLQPPEVAGAHEEVGAEMAWAIMSRFKFALSARTRVSALVREHMFSSTLTPRTARRLIARLDNVPGGVEANVHALFAIRFADTLGGKTNWSTDDLLRNSVGYDLVLRELEQQSAVTVRDLALNGHDLMRFGLKGPQIGEMQRAMLEQVLDDPEANTRENLLAFAAGYVETAWPELTR